MVGGAGGVRVDRERAAATATTTASEPSPTTVAARIGGDEPSENNASFRGVTADTIKVGVVVPDFSALQRAGIPTYYGDYEPAYQAFFDVINEAGGIHGRKIEAASTRTSTTCGQETQDAACTELTEDHEVFIVLGGLLSANNLCFTELHHTMLMTGIFQTEELRERSGDTLWLSLAPVEEAHHRDARREAVAESGAARGQDHRHRRPRRGRQTAVPGYELQRGPRRPGLRVDRRRRLGPHHGRGRHRSEIGAIAQRFMTDGIDFVFSVTEGPGVYEPFEAAGYYARPSSTGRSDPAWWRRPTRRSSTACSASGGAPAPRSGRTRSSRRNCSDVVLGGPPRARRTSSTSRSPGPEEQAEGPPQLVDHHSSGACNHTMLLEQLGEIAGADLTNDTFRAAARRARPVERPDGGEGELPAAPTSGTARTSSTSSGGTRIAPSS